MPTIARRRALLHVAFRRSEHAHARIKAIDCAAARVGRAWSRCSPPKISLTVAPLFATSRMKGYHATPILPLARDKVRYVGEPLVGIVAQSRYLAEDALEMIGIEFEPLAGRHRSAGSARQPTRRCCTRRLAATCMVSREFKRGDVDAALAEPRRCGSAAASACTARPRWRSSRARISPNTMPGRDALTLHSATQVPGIVRDALADRARYIR